MDPLLDSLASSDVSERIEATQDLKSILASSKDLFDDHVARQLPGVLQTNAAHANVKLSLPSIQIIPDVVAYLTRHYSSSESIRQSLLAGFLPGVADKLGDSKPPMRTAALEAMSVLAAAVGSKRVLSSLKEATSHKNWRVREGVMLSLLSLFFDEATKPTLSFKEQDSLLSAISTAVTYLEDANREVRDLASRFLEQAYKCDRAVRGLVKSMAQSLKISAGTVMLQKFDSLDSSSFVVDPESQALVPDVKPIVITTEADMKSHFQQIEKQLGASDSDWDKRVEGIQHIQALVLGGAAKVKGFYQQIKAIEEPIHSQLREARSTALKEACKLVSLLARALGSQFAAMFDVYLASLLRSVCVTIQIISDSADYCIQNVLRYTPLTQSTLQQILTAAQTSKHNTIRIKCSSYLLQLITDRNMTYIDKFVEILEVAISKCTVDSANQVRATARLAYIAFSRRWPERTTRLSSVLESTVKTAIAKDEASPATEQALSELAAAAAAGSFKKPTTNTNPPASTLSSTPKAMKSSLASAKSTGLGLGGPSRVAATASAPALVVPVTSVALQQPPSVLSAAPVPSLVRPALIAPKLGQVASAPSGAPTTPSVRSAAQRVPLVGSSVTLSAQNDTGVSVLGGAARVPAPTLMAAKIGSSENLASESALLKRPPMSAKKTVASAAALPSTPGNALRSHGPSRIPLANTSVAESPAPIRRPALQTSTNIVSKDTTIGLDESQVFTMVMIQASHQDWAERAKAIAVLRDRLSNAESSKKFQQHILSSDIRSDRLVQILSQRLADPHFKVIQQCVDLLVDLISIVPDQTMDAWVNDRLLPPILALQKDEKMKALSQVALSALMERSGEQASVLLNSTLRAVELSEIKVKLGALKFLITMISHAPFQSFMSSHFASQANMQQALRKLARYGKWESCNDLRFTMLDLLTAIAEKFQLSFSSCFLSAGFSNQDELLKKIRLRCPSLTQVAFEIPKNNEILGSGAAVDAAARRSRLVRTKSEKSKPEIPAKNGIAELSDAVADLDIQDDETASTGSLGDINSVLSLPPVPTLSQAHAAHSQAPKTPITPRRAKSQHFTPAEARAAESLQQEEALQRSAGRRQPLTPVPRKSVAKSGPSSAVHHDGFFNADNILAGTPLEVLEFAAQQHRTEPKLEIRQGLRRAEDIMHMLVNRENMVSQTNPRSSAVASTQQRVEMSFSDTLQIFQRVLPTIATSRESIQELQTFFEKNSVDAAMMEKVFASLPDFFPSIEKAVSCTDAQIRRMAVMCLVDIRIIVGSSFDTKLSSLSDTSQRLVKLYMKQRMTATATVQRAM
eukprot:TRINITY_DN822_c0_g2_i1.p1 TRINITY_DN822_c0_g2~~TRINITY_DN822_c0_g2_i1.p1  ORF type:complete len:1316 (-),score=238.16 TRINITY_DN822_c0_g2_i1:555-4502(-)